MTLGNLERPKRHSCRNEKNYGAHHKNFDEDSFILPAAKCWPMFLVVSRNKKYMRIFAGGGFFGRGVNYSQTIVNSNGLAVALHAASVNFYRAMH